MKTPKEYTKALKENKLTPEIISDALFSYSKRAKNYRDKIAEYRDKARMYRYCFSMFDNVETYTEKKEELYRKKSDILLLDMSYCKCIHIQKKTVKRRIYDYEKEYAYYCNEEPDEIIWSNRFYDHEKEDFTYFIDIIDKDADDNLYFLYFVYPNHSFHHPIEKSELKKLSKY